MKGEQKGITRSCALPSQIKKKVFMPKISLLISNVKLIFTPFMLCPRSLVSIATWAISLGLIRSALQPFHKIVRFLQTFTIWDLTFSNNNKITLQSHNYDLHSSGPFFRESELGGPPAGPDLAPNIGQ